MVRDVVHGGVAGRKKTVVGSRAVFENLCRVDENMKIVSLILTATCLSKGKLVDFSNLFGFSKGECPSWICGLQANLIDCRSFT